MVIVGGGYSGGPRPPSALQVVDNICHKAKTVSTVVGDYHFDSCFSPAFVSVPLAAFCALIYAFLSGSLIVSAHKYGRDGRVREIGKRATQNQSNNT